MKYEIIYNPSQQTLIPSHYTIICNDVESKAFLKAINQEIKRMETDRKRELRTGLREGITSTPHKEMKKQGNKFLFEKIHLNDILTAGHNIANQRQRIRVSFLGHMITITPELMSDFEKKLVQVQEK